MTTTPTPKTTQRLAYTPPHIVDLELEATESKLDSNPLEVSFDYGPS